MGDGWIATVPGITQIKNGLGTLFAQRKTLKFYGATVVDDSVNKQTIVDCTRVGSTTLGTFTDEMLEQLGALPNFDAADSKVTWYLSVDTNSLVTWVQAKIAGKLLYRLDPRRYPPGTTITGFRAKVDPADTTQMSARLISYYPGPANSVGTPAGTDLENVVTSGSAAQVITKSGISRTLEAGKQYWIEVRGQAEATGATCSGVWISGTYP